MSRLDSLEVAILGSGEVILSIMLRAVGFVIGLYFVSVILSDAFAAFERAMVATFATIETVAEISTEELSSRSH